MNERKHFIDAYRRGDDTVAALARRFAISRKTAYKWIGRYFDGSDLEDRSRRPKSNSRAIDDTVVAAVVAARKERPHWGAKKLRQRLTEDTPDVSPPSASTMAAIFKRHGLVRPKRRRQRTPPATAPFGVVRAPNDLWCIDFKGDFPVGGKRCYPLTITDAHSRYLVACVALRRTDGDVVRRVLEKVFEEFGLPKAMRSDNGSPFASRGPHGVSKLSAWWLKLGIRHERIEPGKPQQNGRHERMHLTLKQWLARKPVKTMLEQQRLLDLFRAEYNDIRPHEALGQKTPASRYEPSRRALPLPPWGRDFRYPSHWETSRLTKHGVLVWNGRRVVIGEAFRNELVGLDYVDGGWEVHFGGLRIGTLVGSGAAKRRLKLVPAPKMSPMSKN